MNFYTKTLSRSFSNGMAAYVLPRPGGTAMVECYIKTGSIHEGAELGCGLSHFLEHMLFQGCKGYPGTAAADTLQQAGCSVNAYTSFAQTVYHSSGPAARVPLMLEILSSMIRYPELPEERFAAERDVILREYDRCQDDPGRRLQEEFFKLLFLKNPMRIPIIGKRNMIADVTAQMAADYHRRRYTPGRCFWVITGDVECNEVFDRLESLLGDWQDTCLAESFFTEPEPSQYTERSTEFIFTDTVSRFTTGIKTTGDLQKKMPRMDILFGLLGMGSGSRLNRKFELNEQLALGLRSFCYSLNGYAIAGITAVSSTQNRKKLESALKKELEKVANGDLSAAEIIREKNQQYAEYLRQLEELEPVSAVIGAGVMEYGNPAMGDFYHKQLAAVTPEQIRSTAAELLDSTQFCTARQLTRKTESIKVGSTIKRNSPEQLSSPDKIPLLLIRDKNIPLIHFSLVLPGGIIFEKNGKAGSAKLTAALLGAGTRRHSENHLLTALDRYGANFSVSSGNNSIGIELDAPRRYFQNAFSVMTEILSEPLFGQQEFEREQKRLLEILASRKTAALESAFDRARMMLFSSHPYAAGQGGTEETVRGLTAEDIRMFYRNSLGRVRATAGFSGDLSEAEAAKWSTSLFDALSWHDNEPVFPDEPHFPDKDLQSEIPLEREQAAVIVAAPGERFSNSKNHLIYQLLSKSENGLASKLFKEVREKRALAYSVGMDMMGGFHPGWFAFYAQTRADQTAETIEQLYREIYRLAESGLDEEEFSRAKEREIYAELRQNASISGRLTLLLLELFYDRNALQNSNDKISWLKNLSREEANKTIQKTFSSDIKVTVKAGNF